MPTAEAWNTEELDRHGNWLELGRYLGKEIDPLYYQRTYHDSPRVHRMTTMSLPVVNIAEAKFECTFGRGCDGICCQNGRPPIYPDEEERISKNLKKFLPHLRPTARKLIEKAGYMSKRLKAGQPMLRVEDGWCVFFNQGCVLHKVGAAEGDKYRYKPYLCSIFPLGKGYDDEWYVRQWDYKDEDWHLFCLNPKESPTPAAESLKEEVAFLERTTAEEVKAKKRHVTKKKPARNKNRK